MGQIVYSSSLVKVAPNLCRAKSLPLHLELGIDLLRGFGYFRGHRSSFADECACKCRVVQEGLGYQGATFTASLHVISKAGRASRGVAIHKVA